MRRAMNVLMVALLATPVLALEQGDDVQKVLADMKAALGGADKVAAVRSMTMTGRTLRAGLTGATTENEFEMALELPDKFMVRSVLANLGNMSIYRNSGFNGTGLINLIDQPPSLGGGGQIGQMIMRFSGGGGTLGAAPTAEERAKADEAMLRTQQQEFARLMLGFFGASTQSLTLDFSLGGEAESADGKAWIVDARGADGFEARLFIDAKTHLPLMQSWADLEPLTLQSFGRGGGAPGGQAMTMRGRGAGGQMSADEQQKLMADVEARLKEAEASRRKVEYRMYFSSYKAVGGLKLPHTIRRSIDGKPTEEMFFEQVRINPKIDARKFEVTK